MPMKHRRLWHFHAAQTLEALPSRSAPDRKVASTRKGTCGVSEWNGIDHVAATAGQEFDAPNYSFKCTDSQRRGGFCDALADWS